MGAVQNRFGNLLGGLGGPGGALDKINFRSIKSLAPYALTVGSFIMGTAAVAEGCVRS